MHLGDNNPLAQIFQVMKMQSLLKYFTVHLQRPTHAEATLTSDKTGRTPAQQALKAFCWAVRHVLRLPAFLLVQKGTSRQKWVFLSFCVFLIFMEGQHPRGVLWTIHPHQQTTIKAGD